MKNKLLLLILASLILSCSSPTVSDGSSNSVGNPIVMITAVHDGNVLDSASVYVAPVDAKTDSEFVAIGSTDMNGTFRGEIPIDGAYRISVISKDSSSGAIVDLLVSEDSSSVSLATSPMTEISLKDLRTAAVPASPFRGTGTILVPSQKIPALTVFENNVTDTLLTNVDFTNIAKVEAAQNATLRQICSKSQMPIIDSIRFAASIGQDIFIFESSKIHHLNSAGTWESRLFSGTTFTAAASGDSSLWAQTDSGLMKVTTSGYISYTDFPAELSNSDIAGLTVFRNEAVFISNEKIVQFDGASWKTVPLPSEIVDSVTVCRKILTGSFILGTAGGSVWSVSGDGTSATLFSVPTLDEGKSGIASVEQVSDTTVWLSNKNMVVQYDLFASKEVGKISTYSSIIGTFVYPQNTNYFWVHHSDGIASVFGNHFNAYNSQQFPIFSRSCRFVPMGNGTTGVILPESISILTVHL